MPTFNYTVDTQPMADELSSVSRHVDATTTAVVAMQTAVIIAEERAANHVCANVNRGFYSLIRSQISQKLAKLQSDVDSHLMQLRQQKNALLNIKGRMQRDYNMISARYIKLFNGLNTNLKNRIFELDKPTIDFAHREIERMSNRSKYLTASIPVNQLESISSSQKIIASNVKQKGAKVIDSMKSFLKDMNAQKKLTDQILVNDNRISKTSTAFIPIIVYEYNIDKADQKITDVIVSKVELSNITQSSIKNKVLSESAQIEWKQNTTNSQEINSEISKMLSSSSKSQRVKDLALQLFQSNNYQAI